MKNNDSFSNQRHHQFYNDKYHQFVANNYEEPENTSFSDLGFKTQRLVQK